MESICRWSPSFEVDYARSLDHSAGGASRGERASKTNLAERTICSGLGLSQVTAALIHCVHECLLRFNSELKFWFCFSLGGKKNKLCKGRLLNKTENSIHPLRVTFGLQFDPWQVTVHV